MTISSPAALPAQRDLRPTILVVEDEVLLRMWISDELRDNGFTVLEAASGEEAIEIFNSAIAVDLVFTDVRVPGAVDGISLTRWLRREQPDLKIIVTSANRVAPEGDAFVAKPYAISRVVGIIRDLLHIWDSHGTPAS